MLRILITDDHEVARRGVAEVLREALPGAEVGHAAAEDAALLLLTGERWDLHVLDLDLGGRSALDLLRRSRVRWPELPVLALGAPLAGEDALQALRLGAAGYVAKAAGAADLAAAACAVAGGGSWVGGLLDALGPAPWAPRQPPEARLSTRERQVARLVAGGRSAREIAEALGVSVKTVATYRARLAAKLGASTVVELTRWAWRSGLLES